MTQDKRAAALTGWARQEAFGQGCALCLRITCDAHIEQRNDDFTTIREALAAPDARVAELTIVGTCDWGDCDGETVGIRLDRDARWLSVCAEHSEICRAMDAIWRLTCLPFSDADRHVIQGIALAYIDGIGPKPGSQVAEYLAARAPGEPKPYTDPCPKCDGRGFTRETVDGQRESDKCGWCHGGGVVPGEPKEVEPPFARQFLSGAVPGHCFDIDNQTWHQPGERCTRCGFGIEARQ